jgi:hypothetical protein
MSESSCSCRDYHAIADRYCCLELVGHHSSCPVILRELTWEIVRLKGMLESAMDRIAAQSEILSRRAEKL